MIPRPRAVLLDLFHTLACVPRASDVGLRTVPAILGVSAEEWERLYHVDDVLGRCLGHVRDPVEVMSRLAHLIDPAIAEDRILAAVASRRQRFETGLLEVESGTLEALDRLRAAGIRTALVSDAGADDVEAWPRSPLRDRLDHVVFSYQVGVRKPDRRMYQHALDGLGVGASDACFVGDGGSDELRGARSVGLRTVLVTRLLSTWWPDRAASRREHADHEFEDVAAFVATVCP